MEGGPVPPHQLPDLLLDDGDRHPAQLALGGGSRGKWVLEAIMCKTLSQNAAIQDIHYESQDDIQENGKDEVHNIIDDVQPGSGP